MFELLLWLALFTAGYLLIYFAADFFIDNLKELSLTYKLSPFVVGLIILGIDPEESIASIIAALNGLTYISVGNVIGNSIISLTLCFSLPALYYEVKFKRVSQFYFWLIYVCLIAMLMGFFVSYGFFISCIIALIVYFVYLYRNFKHFSEEDVQRLIKDREFEEEKEEGEEVKSKVKMILFVIISFLFIFLGGELLIFATDKIIELTGISESLFGFVIIGFVTNVEEITLVIKSIKKHSVEIGLGGMIGKLIWNLTITYGISGLIAINIIFIWILLWNWLLLLIIVIFFNIRTKKELLTRVDGAILAILFVVFLIINFI